MSKSLKTIQTFSKVGRIIAKICFILSIIGAIGCLIAILSIVGTKDLEFEGQTMVGIIEASGVTFVTVVFDCCQGLISCIGSAVLSKFAVNYFTNELDDGTPFTYNGAKEIFRLGILSIAIPVGISIVLGIAFTVTKLFWPQLDDNALISESISLTTGLLLIVMSFVFRHGAEIAERTQSDNTIIL